MAKNLQEILTTDLEPDPLALRREFPDMIRDIVATGAERVSFVMDAQSALNLANDVEFAVEHRKLRTNADQESSN